MILPREASFTEARIAAGGSAGLRPSGSLHANAGQRDERPVFAEAHATLATGPSEANRSCSIVPREGR